MLGPLPPDEWADELAAIKEGLGTPLNVHRVLANHPALLQAWMPFRDHIVHHSTLTPRQREIVILRTAFHGAVEYEWVHHVARGKTAGLTDTEIEKVRQGAGLHGVDALLVQAVDECYYSQLVLPETRDALARTMTAQQILDVVLTVGMYMALTLVLETFDVPLEDDYDEPPDA